MFVFELSFQWYSDQISCSWLTLWGSALFWGSGLILGTRSSVRWTKRVTLIRDKFPLEFAPWKPVDLSVKCSQKAYSMLSSLISITWALALSCSPTGAAPKPMSVRVRKSVPSGQEEREQTAGDRACDEVDLPPTPVSNKLVSSSSCRTLTKITRKISFTRLNLWDWYWNPDNYVHL